MAEYINREMTIKKLQMQLLDLEADQDKGEYSELCENRGARDALDEAICDIRTIKAADVQSVKHGKWDGYICSECNICADYFISGDFYFDEKPNFCPNCGARMDGDTEMSKETSINEVLKPCPFCGGKVTAFQDNYNKIGIECKNCDLYFGIELECGEGLGDGWRAKIDTAFAAVMKWNRRAAE